MWDSADQINNPQVACLVGNPKQVMLVVDARENRASSRARFVKHAHATSRQDTPGFGVGGVTVTFMSTCRPRTCYVTPGFGVGGSLLMFMSACRPHIFLFI